MKTKLIIIDGMPGSGKSTTGVLLQDKLNELGIRNKFYHELVDNHPLRIYDRQFTSFTKIEEAEWFIEKVKELFSSFMSERLKYDEVTIIESYLFQNTIGFAYNMGMKPESILELTETLQNILSQLEPVLIYYYQVNVEQNWRWICEVRGPEFAQDRCGLNTDEDYLNAGIFWTKNQDFVFKIIQDWKIPKLVIRNVDYQWDEYRERIFEFLKL